MTETITEQTGKEYKFKEPDNPPSYAQQALLGRNFIAKKLNQSIDSTFTQGVVSKEIDSLNEALGKEVKKFTLKSPDNTATFHQFRLLGNLYAESKGLTTMKTASDAIKGFENASRD